jgi:phenylpropionate dioxygenase-like ring-hydroxylating dioxygenase large terminal subunit
MINDPILINDWHVMAPANDLPEGGLSAVRLLGEDIVLWRLNGQVLAWQDLCLHRGTRLSLGKIEAERLVCPYHGWSYDGAGQCVHIPAHPEQTPPAKARVKRYQAQEKYGLIWVTLGQPAQDVAHFPEWSDDSYRKILCGPYEFRAAGPRAIENFLDVAHFPFVHAGLLGDEGHAEIEDYEAEIGPDGVIARDIRVWQPDPDGTGVGATVSYTYQAMRPLTAYFVKSSEGPSFAIYFAVTPVEELHSIGWMWMAMNYGHDIPAAELRAFEDKIVAQDVPIVESQRPELLPLDLQAELHLRSDRTAIAYRQWLRQLGLTFGTS